MTQEEIDNILNLDSKPSFRDIAETLDPKKEKQWNENILVKDETDAFITAISNLSKINHNTNTNKKIEIVDWRRPPFLSIENKKVLNELIYRALNCLNRNKFCENIIKKDDYTELTFYEFALSLDSKDISFVHLEQSKKFKKNKIHFVFTVLNSSISIADVTEIFNEIFCQDSFNLIKVQNEFKTNYKDHDYGVCFSYVVVLKNQIDHEILNIYISKEMIQKIKKLTWDVLERNRSSS